MWPSPFLQFPSVVARMVPWTQGVRPRSTQAATFHVMEQASLLGESSLQNMFQHFHHQYLLVRRDLHILWFNMVIPCRMGVETVVVHVPDVLVAQNLEPGWIR